MAEVLENHVSFKFVKRLGKFEDHKIGLERDKVRLESFNSKWKRLFSDEAYLIFDELRDESLRLYHCGSTAVHGLASKPIVDILGSVSSLEDLDRQKAKLELIGYEYKGEYGLKGRRYCVLYNPEKTVAYVHLHMFQHGNAEIEKHLQFRNYLRTSPEAMQAYLTHKQHLVESIKISRDHYSDAKNDVIAKIQKDATSQKSPQKVLAVFGAADGHKNTLEFLQECYAARSIEIIDLNHSMVTPYSYSQRPADHFQMIIRKAIDADLLVFATPVYWYAMPGGMKDFVDRFSNLLTGECKHLGESLYGKKIEVCSTGSDPQLPLGFEVPFANTAVYFGMDYMGAAYKSMR
jgi:GrpB-like predicted nucleotidyltransferase (UPF0157 family)